MRESQAAEQPLILTQPGIRAVLGAVVTIGALPPLERAVRDVRSGDFGAAAAIFFTAMSVSALGLWTWAYARRKILATSTGVEAVGIHGNRIAWDDVKSIEAHGLDYWGSIYVISDSGVRIVVDQSLHGWQQFLRKLPYWLEGEEKVMAERAISQLTQVGRGL